MWQKFFFCSFRFQPNYCTFSLRSRDQWVQKVGYVIGLELVEYSTSITELLPFHVAVDEAVYSSTVKEVIRQEKNVKI